MNLKLTSAATMAFVSAKGKLAQDPTTVEPTHHQLAFENDEAQVVDVHYGPHPSSKLDSRPGGVVVYVTRGIRNSGMRMARSKQVYAKAGKAPLPSAVSP